MPNGQCFLRSSPKKLGLITDGYENQRRKLDVEALHSMFEIVIVSSEVGVAKLDARIFRMVCTALAVQPAEAIYLGDSYELDVQGALGAGLLPVWLRRKAEHLESPGTFTIRTLNE